MIKKRDLLKMSYFGNDWRNYLGFFDYYFVENDQLNNEKLKGVKKFDSMNLRDIMNRAMESTIIVYDVDIDIPYTQFVLPVLYAISNVFEGYFILLSDYRIYGNTITPKNENDEIVGYGEIPEYLAAIEQFVKKIFKKWLIIRKPEIYGDNNSNVINKIIFEANREHRVYIPFEINNYLPIISRNDFNTVLEYLIDRRCVREIVNIVDETLDLFMLKNILPEGITIEEDNDLLVYSVNMVSRKLRHFYKPQYKLQDFFLNFEKVYDKMLTKTYNKTFREKKGGRK